MLAQMIRVISSPSSSTTGLATLIFGMMLSPDAGSPAPSPISRGRDTSDRCSPMRACPPNGLPPSQSGGWGSGPAARRNWNGYNIGAPTRQSLRSRRPKPLYEGDGQYFVAPAALGS